KPLLDLAGDRRGAPGISLAADNPGRVGTVLESMAYRHWVRIYGLIQLRGWSGCLADLAPARVEPAATLAFISCAFGRGIHRHLDLCAFARRLRRDFLGNAVLALNRRHGYRASLQAARCPPSLCGRGLGFSRNFQ